MKLPNIVTGYRSTDVLTNGEPCHVVLGDHLTPAGGIMAQAETPEGAAADFFRCVDAMREVCGVEDPGGPIVTWVVPGPQPGTATIR